MKAVEDGLRRLDGVGSMTTDLQRNVVTIDPADDVALDLAAIPDAIVDAGFRAGRMWVRAAGHPTAGGDAFLIDGWPVPLPVTGSISAREGPSEFEVLHEGDRLVLRPGAPPFSE